MIDFILNGVKKQYDGDPEVSLLNYLRNIESITSPKDGCSGQAYCGACTVQLDNKAVTSCTTKMKKVAGRSVTTTDGLGQKVQDAFAHAFVEKGGIQCGFCTPGIVMQARTLLLKNPAPTRKEIAKALDRNLCRCTGYKKIIDSVLYAAEILINGNSPSKPDHTGKVGTRHPKYGAHATVLGQRPFVCDLTRKGLQFGALRFSDHPRAKVISIDTSEAENISGVTKIVTAADIPGEQYIGLIVKDWPLMIRTGEITRYIGDVLAGVVATTEAVAREASAKIKIEYAVLNPVTSPAEAVKSDAPQIHPGGNILSLSGVKRGDIDKAIKKSAYVTTGTYNTQRIEHAFIETESCLAEPWNDSGTKGIKVHSQGQGAYEDRKQISSILGIPVEQVNVIQVANGGGFGGKEDLSVQGHAALFSFLTNVPVKVTLTRPESICMHPKRHPIKMDYTLGCDKNGKLTALKAYIVGDTGAYASVGMKVLERAVGHATSAYTVPVVHIKGAAVYTNNIPCGAMRGFGVNQAAFAMESCIDELCTKGGFDRWKFRYENATKEGDMISTGQVIKKAAGVRKCLEAIKDDFYEAKYAGIACGIKNCGIGNGMPDTTQARVDIINEDKVIIHHGWSEMGQGVHTMAVQTLCEETGIDPSIIEVVVDTSEDTVCGMTTSSRGTSLVGHALIDACKKLKVDLKNKNISELKGKSYKGEWICDWTTEPGKEKPGQEPVTHYSYSYAAQLVTLDDKGKVNKVVAAHDAGRIMNPTLFEGQIEGSVHMGLGYALSENLELKECRPVSTKLKNLGILKASKVPEINVIGVEVPDPNGPYGAKGVGEIGLVPTAGAVANALYQFDKKRRYSLPLQKE